MKILFELRPALSGHGGIPQETRLLFSALQSVRGSTVDGLLPATALAPLRRARAWHLLATAIAAGGSLFDVLRRRSLALAAIETSDFESLLWTALYAKTLESTERDRMAGVRYRLMKPSWLAAHLCGIVTGALGEPLHPLLDTREYDIVLAETPFPARLRAGTRLLVRYHDDVPMSMPETLRRPRFDAAAHKHALQSNVKQGAWFACVSQSTRDALVERFPEVAPRAVVVPNLVAPQYAGAMPDLAAVLPLLDSRSHAPRHLQPSAVRGAPPLRRPPRSGAFVLMVSTLEPRKDHLTLLRAWRRLRADGWPSLQLVWVGELGWRHQELLREAWPDWLQGDLHVLTGLSADELRTLYCSASAVVCTSRAEGFGYSGVEALICGAELFASDIAIHREVYGEAATYFSTGADETLAQQLAALLRGAGSAHEDRRRAARDLRKALRPETLLLQWQELLQQVWRAA